MNLRTRSITPSIQEKTVPEGVISLVLSVSANVKEIACLGKKYPWQRPTGCPHCGGKLWWHGFVLAYFACLVDGVYLRRLYCPDCYSVHRLRPAGYWQQFRSTVHEIRSSLIHRVKKGRWRPDLPRGRQRMWWRRLRKMVLAVLGVCFSGSLADGFDHLVNLGIIPVSCAKKNKNGTIR